MNHRIQYLRAIAALLVVWHHALGQIDIPNGMFNESFGIGGVDIFFVISGYIMAKVVSSENVRPLDFLINRFIRIAPMYWLTTLSLVTAHHFRPDLFKQTATNLATIAQSLLFIPHFSLSHTDKIWPILVPGWTLNYEMFFYVVFAISLAFRQRTLVITAIFISAVVLGQLNPPTSAIGIFYSSPIVFEFLAGILIFRLSQRDDVRWAPHLTTGLAALGAWFIWVEHSEYLPHLITPLGAFLLVLGCALKSQAARPLALLLAIGNASYSIYLSHIFTLGVLRTVWFKVSQQPMPSEHIWPFLLAAMLASTCVGYGVYAWIERPIQSRLKVQQKQT